MSANLY